MNSVFRWLLIIMGAMIALTIFVILPGISGADSTFNTKKIVVQFRADHIYEDDIKLFADQSPVKIKVRVGKEVTCNKFQDWKKNTVRVCDTGNPFVFGWTIIQKSEGATRAARVALNGDSPGDESEQRDTVCHEMIHALTWASESEAYKSCNGDGLTKFGRKFLKEAY